MYTKPDPAEGHPVRTLYHRDRMYQLVIFSSDDDRVELQDEDQQSVLVFTADLYVRLPQDKNYLARASQDAEVARTLEITYSPTDYGIKLGLTPQKFTVRASPEPYLDAEVFFSLYWLRLGWETAK